MAKLASSSTFALDFLRRLLCAHTADDRRPGGGAPRHACCAPPEAEEPTRSPCIVARLMGLDALPPELPAPHAQPLLQSQPLRTPPLPLRRSRSASSAEGSPSPSPWEREQQQPPSPRVVRASASLRERPAFLRQESDEFLLLSFSPDEDQDDPERASDVKEELDFLLAAAKAEAEAAVARGGGKGKTRNGRCRRLRFADDEAEAESAGRVLGLRRRRRTPAAECDAHSSSPVSVLEAHDESSTTTTTTTSSSLEEVEHAEPCSATSDEPQTILDQKNSRRNLHPDFFPLDNLSPPRNSCHVSRCSDRERRNRRVVNKDEVITPEVSVIWQPICRLVEEDLKNMEWSTRDGTNAVAEIECGILEHLMCEMVDELLREMSETVHHPFPLQCISNKKSGGKNVQTRRAIGCY